MTEITTVDDTLFQFNTTKMPKVYQAFVIGDAVTIASVYNNVRLASNIYYGDVTIDGVTPKSANEAASLINAVVFSKAGASASTTGKATKEIKIDYKGVASSFTVFENHRFYDSSGKEIAPENFVLLSKSEYVMRGEIGKAIKTQNLEVTTNKSANIVFSCAGTALQRYVFDARQNVDSLNLNWIKITFEDDEEQNLPIYRRFSNDNNLIILQ